MLGISMQGGSPAPTPPGQEDTQSSTIERGQCKSNKPRSSKYGDSFCEEQCNGSECHKHCIKKCNRKCACTTAAPTMAPTMAPTFPIGCDSDGSEFVSATRNAS